MADRGVRANVVAPGFVATDMTKGVPRGMADRVPLGRFARPEEIAAAVVFLASPRSSYITAATLVVDGGISA